MLLKPLSDRANESIGKKPEKTYSVYIRLVIYLLAEFIAFVADMFLIVFAKGYDNPWCLSIVFIGIAFYKIWFVLFRDFKNLGFNARGFIDALKMAYHIVDRDKNSISNELDNTSNHENNKDMDKYDNRTSKGLMGILLIFICSLTAFGFTSSTRLYANKHVEIKEIKVEPKVIEDNIIIFKLYDEPVLKIRLSEK